MPMPVAMPALRNAMSTRPCASSTARTAATFSSYDVTSQRTNVPPTSAATFSPLSTSMSLTTTVAPRPASRRATPAPKPLAPPVIHATLPSYRRSLIWTSLSAEDLLGDRPRPRADEFGETLGALHAEVVVRRGRGGVGARLDLVALLLPGGGELVVVGEDAFGAKLLLE